MRAGKLRELIDIELGTSSRDGVGSRSTSWAKIASCWAQFEPVGGADGLVQGGKRETKQYKVTIRYREISAADHRLVWNGTPYKIHSALPDEHRALVVMQVESGTGASG